MQKKRVSELRAGDRIVADLAQPNLVIQLERLESGEFEITTQGGVFVKEGEFEVNVKEASVFERTTWTAVNDFWGNKEGDNRKFTKESLAAFVLDVKAKADLCEEAEAQ